MLPTVDFCGIKLSKMLIGANPFGGYSHLSKEASEKMEKFHTEEKIFETWDRAYAAGITGFATNTNTEKVLNATCKYLANGGPMKWLAQLEFGKDWENPGEGVIEASLDRAASAGAAALFLQGEILGQWVEAGKLHLVRKFVEYAHTKNVPVGIAGHDPEHHYLIDKLDLVDFHVIPFFNCVNDNFRLEDLEAATRLIRYLRKPCIAYKVLGAGRIEPKMGFSYALRNIKPNDCILVGMSRHADDDQVEKNVVLLKELIANPIL